MKLLLIIIGLFVALFFMVMLVERFTTPMSAEKTAKVTRWLPLLIVVSIVLAIMREGGFF
ncbi:hypothetical protein EDC56_1307 [Sinobacterium caligoides]|uniref:Uncharacterized protein n=1 Tax=Sinobacterium caligoides TaxID=933926 RepID=A0A3N2E2F0_9GAMM|nr:hypothetical protein [Sinobacterium caligoides]ROS05755.1 hypothetical protein EDC56_1307 [Sinobacterium caligoides]